MHLIQGFIYQNVSGLVLKGGPTLSIRSGMMPIPFAGVVWDSEESAGLEGHMWDEFGDACLTYIRMTPAEVRFRKLYMKYGGKPDSSIDYIFRLDEAGTWFGEYQSQSGHIAPGRARCIITQVEDRLFKADLANEARFEDEYKPLDITR